MLRSNKIGQELPSDFYERLFAQLPQSKIVFMAESPFTIVEVDDRYLGLTHLERNKLVGSKQTKVFPEIFDEQNVESVDALKETVTRVVRSRQPCTSAFRHDVADESGRVNECYWNVTHYPITGAAGSVRYILQVITDVTVETIAQQGLAEVHDKLENALSVGKVGSWMWDVDKKIITLGPNLSNMCGIDPKRGSDGIPTHVFAKFIRDEDRSRISKSMFDAVESKKRFEEEFGIIDSKQKQRWVLARGRVEDNNGHAVFPGLIVDITERRDMQAEITLARQQDRLNRQSAKALQARNDELEAVSRTKDEFVALASHQLRTPATAVKQYIGMVLQGYAGDISELQTEMLEKAFESNERQIQIINQILNAARVDTGRLVMTTASLDVRVLVEGVSNDMASTLDGRHQKLVKQLTSKPTLVMADAGYMRMVVENLMHNASNYTPDGGTITVNLNMTAKYCKISISDNGVGIKKGDLNRLFTKFSRIHNSLSVQAGGSGIGLYLAAEIVRLHKGTITVDSSIHKGSTFMVTLPLVRTDVKTA